MEILWTALWISVLVGFIFFVLAQYWRRALAAHSRALRQLSSRVRALEEVDNPEFRERIERASPVPLVRVYSFVLQLDNEFWEKTLGATAQELAFVWAHGAFLGSVKIEEWRSHSVATVYEVVPRQSGEWRARSIEIYPCENGAGPGSTLLWELPLGISGEGSLELPSGLELRLGHGRLRFGALHGRFGCDYSENGEALPKPKNLFLDIPLDPARLNSFRRDDEAGDPSRSSEFGGKFSGDLFGHRDDACGVEWRLAVRDLQRAQDSPGWRTWEVVPGRGTN